MGFQKNIKYTNVIRTTKEKFQLLFFDVEALVALETIGNHFTKLCKFMTLNITCALHGACFREGKKTKDITKPGNFDGKCKGVSSNRTRQLKQVAHIVHSAIQVFQYKETLCDVDYKKKN